MLRREKKQTFPKSKRTFSFPSGSIKWISAGRWTRCSLINRSTRININMFYIWMNLSLFWAVALLEYNAQNECFRGSKDRSQTGKTFWDQLVILGYKSCFDFFSFYFRCQFCFKHSFVMKLTIMTTTLCLSYHIRRSFPSLRSSRNKSKSFLSETIIICIVIGHLLQYISKKL